MVILEYYTMVILECYTRSLPKELYLSNILAWNIEYICFFYMVMKVQSQVLAGWSSAVNQMKIFMGIYDVSERELL